MKLHRSVYILIKKSLSQVKGKTDSLKTSKNGLNRDFESRFQGNYITYIQTFDVSRNNFITSCYHIFSYEKTSKWLWTPKLVSEIVIEDNKPPLSRRSQ